MWGHTSLPDVALAANFEACHLFNHTTNSPCLNSNSCSGNKCDNDAGEGNHFGDCVWSVDLNWQVEFGRVEA